MNLTVILVSHSMEDIAKLADKIIVMNGGKVEMFAPTAEVFKQGERLTEIGLNIPQITIITDKLRKMGLPLSDGIYTVDAAYRELLDLLKPGGDGR